VIKALMIDVDGVLVSGRPSDERHWAAGLEADLDLSFASFQDAFFKRVTTKLWSLTDMVRVIEDWEAARSSKISGETMVG
jgi:hypothetical protein